MRNLAWFLGSFSFVCVACILLYGCAVPPRAPEPYEKRLSASERQELHDKQGRASFHWWGDTWWQCTYQRRVDEC
jgi:hypothetical protein